MIPQKSLARPDADAPAVDHPALTEPGHYSTPHSTAFKETRAMNQNTTASGHPRRSFLKKAMVLGAAGVGSQVLSVAQTLSSEPAASRPLTAVQAAKVVAIDIGRQLFVDDWLIGDMTLARTFHKAEFCGQNPVLSPVSPVEIGDGKNPTAAPFDDGAWYDPSDKLYKLWYMANMWDGVCYATSRDGLVWERPELDVVPGTNRVLPVRTMNGSPLWRDAATIWLDHAEPDPAARYKMGMYSRLHGQPENSSIGELFTSPDGIHWKKLDAQLGWKSPGWYGGDNCSFYYDPFRRLWVRSIREQGPSRQGFGGKKLVRARYRFAAPDFVRAFTECTSAIVKDKQPWLMADDSDLPDKPGFETELYDFTATPYESLMVGVFAMLTAPQRKDQPKHMDIKLGFSRDGTHFDRPTHEPFLACSRVPGTWNRGYLHPVSGICHVVGDRLHFYISAWSGKSPAEGTNTYGGASTGLAMLRRDGFASVNAGVNPGTLTTNLVSFQGRHPFVNVQAAQGELRMEVLDAAGKVIPPYSAENCLPVSGDGTRQSVGWKNAPDLSSLAGRPVRFRFHLTQARLYSFWVSPDASGASHGYVAAGGPGFTGPLDTTGG
jgi:hypothetical protein